jgi:hypothetical protein
MKYLEIIKESRYKTHGLLTVKRQLPLFLRSIKSISEIKYNHETDDFILKIKNLTKSGLDSLISRCEILGYYPSVFNVNGKYIKVKNIKNIDDFIEIVKNYNINKSDKIWIQFESWLDQEIEVPDKLYHITKTTYVDKIKRYGLSPKSKHKISYHPDRIYLVDNYMVALDILKQLKQIDDDSYSIITIKPDKDVLLLRLDPNYNRGFYTNQNIPPNWIIHIRKS